MEKTLALVKPDAVSAGSAGSIVHRAELDGFVVVDKRTLQVRARAPPFFPFPFFFLLVRGSGREGARVGQRGSAERHARALRGRGGEGLRGFPAIPATAWPRGISRAPWALRCASRASRARVLSMAVRPIPPPRFFRSVFAPKKKVSQQRFWRTRARARPDSPTRSDAG